MRPCICWFARPVPARSWRLGSSTGPRARTCSRRSPGTGEGELHSIEVGRDAREPLHDHFVPRELRAFWRLHIGDSRRELPALFERCSPVDMFYHDSLHTFEHMTWEFRTALPHIGAGGILASDDVLNPPSVGGIFRDGPFPAFCEGEGIEYATFQNLGVALPTAPWCSCSPSPASTSRPVPAFPS
ncbi:MAG: class I SAM-dependent methyltransferase [Gemmatimonadales bacterium]|nr:class I SAM-dependent methyltransferase [Gemmatimonadales bacterium]